MGLTHRMAYLLNDQQRLLKQLQKMHAKQGIILTTFRDEPTLSNRTYLLNDLQILQAETAMITAALRGKLPITRCLDTCLDMFNLPPWPPPTPSSPPTPYVLETTISKADLRKRNGDANARRGVTAEQHALHLAQVRKFNKKGSAPATATTPEMRKAESYMDTLFAQIRNFNKEGLAPATATTPEMRKAESYMDTLFAQIRNRRVRNK